MNMTEVSGFDMSKNWSNNKTSLGLTIAYVTFRRGLVWISTCVISAMISSLLAIALMRALLRQLFSFQGWMYLEHHQVRLD